VTKKHSTTEEQMFPEVEALVRKCGVLIVLSCLITIMKRARFQHTVEALKTARYVYDADRNVDD
jgi:hypothetical protein